MRAEARPQDLGAAQHPAPGAPSLPGAPGAAAEAAAAGGAAAAVGPEGTGSRRSVRWINTALLAAGIAILAAFAATTNFRQVGAALRNVQAALLALAAATMVGQILVKGARWRFMIERLTGTRISTRFGATSVVAGVAAGSVTPGRSFELAKAVMLKASYDVPLGISASAMIVERLLDMAFLIMAFLAAAAFVPTRMVVASRVLVIMIAALALGFGVLVAAPVRLRAWLAGAAARAPLRPRLRAHGLALLETFFASFLRLRAQHTLWQLLLMTAAATAMDIARVFTVFHGMGILLALPLLAFAYLGAAMLGMALLIPGGVGVTEVSMAGLIALLAPGAVAPALARSAVLIDRFLSYYLLVLLGAALLVSYHRLRHVLV
jgi:uncharacterized protein (TIRG00374 family)